MDAKPRTEKRSGLAVVLLAVPLLLASYVLSSGPVACLLPPESWDRIYAPLNWIADRNALANRLLYGYVVQCGVWAGQQSADTE